MHKIIQRSFDRAAEMYDSVAQVQNQSSTDLAELLAKYIDNDTITSLIDIGSGTGNTTLEMYKHFSIKRCTLCDISMNMLKIAHQKLPGAALLHCNAEQYTFGEHYQIGISNFCMQWFKSIDKFINKITQYCDIFVFSTLIDSSFRDYRKLFPYIPVSQYPSTDDIREICNSSSMLLASRQKSYAVQFKNAISAARYLKKLGANVSTHHHADDFKTLRNHNESITLNYDVFFGLVSK